MKLVYEPGEQEYADRLYKESDIKLFNGDPNSVYAISFKVTNPSVAMYVLSELLHKNGTPEFDLGIEIQGLHFGEVVSKGDVQNMLHQMIEGLLG